MFDLNETLSAIKNRELRALSRLISSAENREPSLYPLLKELYDRTGHARVLGFTGPPGAGKSTLMSGLIRNVREKKKTVAFIAVDPVSPYTGGALLGDRIRLADHFNDPDVYIRSLSTRGKLGGLSLATRQVVHLADAFGFDYIFIETVGVGQSEVDIRHLADLTTVVLVPESGDSIQTLKAGILEIADLLLVNKADRPGATELEGELKAMLHLSNKDSVPVLMTSQNEPKSVAGLFKTLDDQWSIREKEVKERRVQANKVGARELLEAHLARETQAFIQKSAGSEKNPYEFLLSFAKKHPPGSLF